MIIVIRISGMVKIPRDVQETLYRIRLRRKYSATLLQDSAETQALLMQVRNFVAYGQISRDMLEKLLEKRGKRTDKKSIDTDKLIQQIEKHGVRESGLKPFFRLHSPRGGIDSRIHFGTRKGVLGDNKEAIDALVERML